MGFLSDFAATNTVVEKALIKRRELNSEENAAVSCLGRGLRWIGTTSTGTIIERADFRNVTYGTRDENAVQVDARRRLKVG